MNIGSVDSTASYQPVQRLPEASEVKGAPEKDGDADDATAKVAAAPTVNTSGQTVGQVINEVA